MGLIPPGKCEVSGILLRDYKQKRDRVRKRACLSAKFQAYGFLGGIEGCSEFSLSTNLYRTRTLSLKRYENNSKGSCVEFNYTI